MLDMYQEVLEEIDRIVNFREIKDTERLRKTYVFLMRRAENLEEHINDLIDELTTIEKGIKEKGCS